MTFSATGTRNSLFDTGWVAWPQLGGRPHSSGEAQAELYSYVGDHQGDTAPCSVTHSRNYQISLLICIQSGLRHVVTIHVTWKLCDWDSPVPKLHPCSAHPCPADCWPDPRHNFANVCRIFASYVAVGSAGAAAEEGGDTGRRRHKIVTKILLQLYLLSPGTARHGGMAASHPEKFTVTKRHTGAARNRGTFYLHSLHF